jgi:hypothetical protein
MPWENHLSNSREGQSPRILTGKHEIMKYMKEAEE